MHIAPTAALLLSIVASQEAPIAYWPGTTPDDVYRKNNSTLLGGARATNMGFEFSGDVNQVAFIPDNGSLALTGSISISCYVYAREFASANATSAQSQIFFRGDDRNGLDPYDLLLLREGLWQFKISTDTETYTIQAPATLFEWTQLTAVFDSEREVMRLYVDGELVAQSYIKGKPIGALDTNYSPGIAIGNVQFPSGPWHRQPFNGYIRDVKVYDKVIKPRK